MASSSKADDDAISMPPPPIPPASSKSPDTKILQPEFEALALCLKDVIVKTSQIYGFYSDAQKLKITHYIPNPPRKLTSALGRDIERYDQLCDSIEAQLHRAIRVLKRDLLREEQKKEEEKRNAAKVASVGPMIEDTAQPSDTERTLPKNSMAASLARRPSTVSISSLQRPQSLKLDLSSTPLRITEEEAAMFQKDLGSPVTLAPKSARPVGPNEFPPDLMMAFSNTPLQTDLVHTMDPQEPLQVGNATMDKTIDLDLDMDIDMANMTDLFGDPADSENATSAVDRLFIPLKVDEGNHTGDNGNLPQKENILEGFHINASVDAELFGEFNPDTGLTHEGRVNTTGVQSGSSVPSPGSILAQFSTSELQDSEISISVNPTLSSSGGGFDIGSIDLPNLDSGFFSAGQNPDIEFHVDMGLIGMDANGVAKTE